MRLQDLSAVSGAYTARVVTIDELRDGFRRVRKARITHEDLAAKTETTGETAINPQTISNIERGITKDPGVETLLRLIDGMGLTPSQFFTEVERRTDSTLPPPTDSATTSTRPQARSAANPQEGGGGNSPVPTKDAIELTHVVSALGISAIEVIERAIDRGFDRLATTQSRTPERRKTRRRTLRRKAS